jgi:transcriptional regulator
MYEPPLFREDKSEAIFGLIRDNPLGLLIAVNAAGDSVADLVPFFAQQGSGPKGTLYAHVARANEQWRILAERGKALVVFQGPQHYVTPSWYETKRETGKVVPTWNYAIVQARGHVSVHEDAEWLRWQIGILTGHMEGRRAEPWAVEDAPADFIAAQMKGIVGLEIAIEDITGKWKVSQNRPIADRIGVALGLDQTSGEPDAAEMAELVRLYGGLEKD